MATPEQAAAPTTSRAVDFSETIRRLEARARKSRHRVRWVIGALAAVVLAGFVIAVGETTNYTTLSKSFGLIGLKRSSFDPNSLRLNRTGVEAPAAGHVMYLLERLNGPQNPYYIFSYSMRDVFGKQDPYVAPTLEEAAALKAELKVALDDLERAARIADIGRHEPSIAEEIRPIVTTFFYSAGIVGVILLLIQICVTFIRYHLQLAEFYDAQADAFRAADGDPNLAIALLRRMPSVVGFEKMPMSLYEKAIDAMKEVVVKVPGREAPH